MAIDLGDLARGAAFFGALVHEVREGERKGLEAAAEIVETEAKALIGRYGYQNWPPLAASTVARKGADTPLLTTGALRESIEHVVEGRSAFVGTNDPKAIYHDLGTSRMPPRPFLMPAAMHKEKEICEAMGDHIIKTMGGP